MVFPEFSGCSLLRLDRVEIVFDVHGWRVRNRFLIGTLVIYESWAVPTVMYVYYVRQSSSLPPEHSNVGSMSITHITSLSQLDAILDKSREKLTVVDFHATWCGPCHAIAPAYEALSRQYLSVNFLKCDVDAAQDVARRYAVSAMPTFLFLKGQTKVDEVKGANKAALENALRKHSSGSSPSAFSGRGQSLGDSSTQPQPRNDDSEASLVNLDPQVKKLLYFLGAYLLFWYLSR